MPVAQRVLEVAYTVVGDRAVVVLPVESIVELQGVANERKRMQAAVAQVMTAANEQTRMLVPAIRRAVRPQPLRTARSRAKLKAIARVASTSVGKAKSCRLRASPDVLGD